MPDFMDPFGRKISLTTRPLKIISLVPSQTELLYDLGLDEEVCGITKFCIHPSHWKYSKEIIGGTKKINIERIRTIEPDLILGNKEENEKDQIELLAHDYPTWISDVKNLEDALLMIRSVGELTGKSNRAVEMATLIAQKFSVFMMAGNPVASAYLIWRRPYRVAASETFINEMMKCCGLINAFGEKSRYPEITIDELKRTSCSIVLLSSEPYPFSEKHRVELESQLKQTRVMLVDGEMFSWYGSRLLPAADYLQSLRLQIQQ